MCGFNRSAMLRKAKRNENEAGKPNNLSAAPFVVQIFQ
jgi:hypothetical protein